METGSGVYTDFQGLANLRAKAEHNSPEALRETADQFEAIFVQMMLKSMRQASSFGGGLFDSEQGKLYQDLYDKQIAMDMSRKGGLGLADMLVKQIESQSIVESKDQGVELGNYNIGNRVVNNEAATDKNRIGNIMSEMKVDDFLAGKKALTRFTGPAIIQGSAQNIKKHAMQQSEKIESPKFYKDPVDFVKAVWKHAKIAASALGLAPEMLAAQAALETGWGKYIMRDADGNSSNNLFGVKAGKQWDGNKVSVGTLEFSNGVMKKENASFRTYNSIEDSFNDYVNFLKSNSRYQEALQSGTDNNLFTKELQRAGYATDPSYADKIINILNGSVFKQALQGLKDLGN